MATIPTIEEMHAILRDVQRVLDRVADGEEPLMGAIDKIHDLTDRSDE